ncbi:MAG TPA: hypothetical protein PKG48_14255, partial [Bacteroidales bacterium]|nr:hypothetical protein [Bacteroidales bacterium]
ITLNYWLKQEKRNWNPKSVLYLALLVALCYFSHIVIFGILMIALATQIVISTLAGMISEGRTWKSQIRQALRNSAAALLSAALPLALFIYFFYSRPEIRDIKFLSKEELLNMIVALRPLVSMNPAIEGKFLQILFYALLFILVAGFLRFVFRLFHDAPADEPDTKTGNTSESLLPRYPFWWILSFLVVLLVLFFKLPDAYGTASYTNLRIGFFILLFTVVWFSTFRIPWFLGLITVLAGLTVNTLLLKYYTPGIRDLGRMATECNKASEFVKPNSLVLPIYCMDNWFTGHFVDYLAVDKPVVMVYNYECESGYFPVRWNENRRKNYYLGNPSFPDRYIHFEIVKNRPSLPLDYVFIVGQYDPAKDWFFSTLHKALTEDYTRLYQAENCSLYGRKSAATY